MHYDASEFIECNTDTFSADFVNLFKGSSSMRASKNTFIKNLFSERTLNLQRATNNDQNVVNVQQVNAPRRKPVTFSQAKQQEAQVSSEHEPTYAADFEHSLESLFNVISATEVSIVFSLRANSTNLVNKYDKAHVKDQVKDFGLADIAKIKQAGYTLCLPHLVFTERYRTAVEGSSAQALDVSTIARTQAWSDADYFVGTTHVFVKDKQASALDAKLRAAEKAERKRIKDMVNIGGARDMDGADSQVSSSYAAGGGNDYESEDGTMYTDGEGDN